MNTLSEKSLLGIRCAADILLASKNAVALTGAGISTPSGIPDFRSPEGGLWTKVDPFEVATLSQFRYNPEQVLHRMRPLVKLIHGAQPNPAHSSLAQMESAGMLKAVITQNVDGLHRKAGSQVIYEVHGTLETLSCRSCFAKQPSPPFMESYLEHGSVPTCPACGDILKPDIVMFGEQLPAKTWLKALEISRKCDLMIVAGSSLEVLPVASLPMRAVENGAHLIIINHSATYIDVRADVVFHDDVDVILPCIVQEVASRLGA